MMCTGVSRVAIITPGTHTILAITSRHADILRPLITKIHVCNIANQVSIFNKKMKKVLHAIRDIIGQGYKKRKIKKPLVVIGSDK